MIKYKLTCIDCSNSFDSWFASSKEFEKIKKLKLLNCHFCKSSNVKKSLMSPNLVNTNKKEKYSEDKKFIKVKNKLKAYQKFIKKNFEYVGDNFTYKARSIHYNSKKNKKGIYGNASLKEVKELKDEGIETAVIPWIKDKDN